MFKLILALLVLTQVFAFDTSRLHRQSDWTWLANLSELTDQQKDVEKWVQTQLPALSGFQLDKAARLGDQMQYHYNQAGTTNSWEVITNGGKGKDKYIERATQMAVENRADGTSVVKKKHIVRNDFLKSIEDYV